MAKNTTMTNAVRDALLGTTGLDIFNNGFLDMYSGSQPTDAGDAEAGTKLVGITLPADAFGSITDGVLSLSGTWEDTSADATGTLSWFRLYDSNHTTGASEAAIRIDGSIGVTPGAFNLVVDSVSVTAGQLVTVVTFDITVAKIVVEPSD